MQIIFEEHHEFTDVHDDWYEEKCIKMDDYCITDERICSSGLGDGCYDVFAEYNGEKCLCIENKISFKFPVRF